MTEATKLPFHAADIQGLLRLGVEATGSVTDVVEAMHHAITSLAGIVGAPPPGRTSGVTGLVYRSVRGTTDLVGRGVDAVMTPVSNWLPAGEPSAQRDAVLAVINGIWGDHLEAHQNPLATRMAFRSEGQAIELDRESLRRRFPGAGDHVIVLVHGLCMNDRQWERNGHDHGRMLAEATGAPALYLHYNSGRHVAVNGREFSELLEQLVAAWPVPLRRLTIIGHSMGGLVTRSAGQHAAEGGLGWLQLLDKQIFLGTPHHGAALERGGKLVEMLLGISPYAAPIAQLTQSRSAGITDLRFGNLQLPLGGDRHAQRVDDRAPPTPLPKTVKTYLVAATTAAVARGLRHQLLGDGLVSVDSALGENPDEALSLKLPSSHRRVITSANHWDLLDHAEVAEQLRTWLVPKPRKRSVVT